MKEPSPRRWKRRIAIIIMAAVFGLLLAIWMRQSSTKGSVTLLPNRGAFRNRVSEMFESVPAALRNPLRKLKYRVLGVPSSVSIHVDLIRATNGVASVGTSNSVTGLFGLPSGAGSNGLQFWILNETAETFRKKLAQTTGPRITSSRDMFCFSGHSAQASSLNPAASEGFVIEALPRAGNNQTDLAFHTNCAKSFVTREGM